MTSTILALKRGESVMTIIDLSHPSNYSSNHVGLASVDWEGDSDPGSSRSSCQLAQRVCES